MGDRYTARAEVLDNAKEYVTTDRNKSYGEPDEDFQRIAAIASGMGFRFSVGVDVVRPLTGSDVALFMIALKTSRLAWNPQHQDSWTDIAGYAACGFETSQLEKKREEDAERALNADLAARSGRISTEPIAWRTAEALMTQHTAEVKEWAEKAITGDPSDLEANGYILVDNPNRFLGREACVLERCRNGHLFHSGCTYLIKKRRSR